MISIAPSMVVRVEVLHLGFCDFTYLLARDGTVPTDFPGSLAPDFSLAAFLM